MIKIINKVEELHSYKDEWVKLCQYSNRTFTPFQHICYICNSWQYLCSNLGELHIVVIIRQKDQQVLAIFPCYIDKKKCLHFINDRHSDFCSAIIRDDHIDDYHLYEEFYEYYQTNNSIEKLQLINIKDDNPMFANLSFFLKGSMNRVVNMYSDFPVKQAKNLQTSFVNDLSRLNTKEKYRLKNVLKKSSGMSLKIYACSIEKYPDEMVDRLIKQMINSGMRTVDYFNNEMMTLFKSLYDAGVLQLFMTYKNEQPIAANLYLINGNEYIDWIAIYTEKKNNLYNLLQAVEYISHRGGSLNFARGTYEYKMHNFRPALHFLYGMYHSKSKLGRFLDLWNANNYYLRQIAKSILRK